MNFPAQVPNPAVRRLSLYLRQLEALQSDRVATVSSRKLAQSLGLTDAQVRKDLGHFGQFGRPGVGYEVTGLVGRLRGILGTDRISPILLVGAGNLGKAVTAYHGFRAKGFELAAVFDNDPRLIGQSVAQLPVQPMTDLPQAAAEHSARLAIVAVPAPAAQAVADQLIAAGVRGILNFAPTRLEAPPGITIRYLDVAAELEQLTFQTNLESLNAADRKEILIVDDSEDSIVFLSQIVEEEGYRFRVARNGKEANRAMADRRPDLVLLDLVMPGKSGIAVFQEMKDDPDLKEIPVVIITGASAVTGIDLETGQEAPKESYGDDVGRRFGLALHRGLRGLAPDGLIEKPVDPALLSRKIEGLLS